MVTQTIVTTIPFNTQTGTLIDANWKDTPLDRLARIVIEGALETGDKTKITINDKVVELYGTFNWKCNEYDVKTLKIIPAFIASRIGLLTIHYQGEDVLLLKSKYVGTSAALPANLQSRLS